MTEPLALLLLGLASLGCASTSGQDWLSTPLDAQTLLAPDRVDTSEAVVEARPRLAHTVTLGESYESAAVSPGVAGPPPVQVNVNTQVPVIINNWGGYGYGYGAYGYGSYGAHSVSAPVRTTTRSTATKVGADFPAPPDYGPRALK
jgi:hypothetical protein